MATSRSGRAPLRAVALVLALAACSSTESTGVDTTGAPTTDLPTTEATTTDAPTTDVPTSDAATTSAPATTSNPATSTAPTTTVPTPPATEPPDQLVQVAITVSGGQVIVVDDRVDVPLGSDVEITVVTDVSDEVHVHGYDLFGNVSPGVPATVAFTADIPGLFEVELESAGLLLVELQVS